MIISLNDFMARSVIGVDNNLLMYVCNVMYVLMYDDSDEQFTEKKMH